MSIYSSILGRNSRHSLLRLPALCGAIALVTSCSSDSSKSSDELSGFFEAVDAACEQSSCRAGNSARECKFFLPYDLLTAALQSKDFDACVEQSTTWLSCGATADGCFDAAECGEDPLKRAECAIVKTPKVEPLFAGAAAHCERQVACYADLDGSEAQVQQEEAECLADLRARFEIYRNHGSACGNAFRDMMECLADAKLACGVSAEDEEAACPAQIANWESSCAP